MPLSEAGLERIDLRKYILNVFICIKFFKMKNGSDIIVALSWSRDHGGTRKPRGPWERSHFSCLKQGISECVPISNNASSISACLS